MENEFRPEHIFKTAQVAGNDISDKDIGLINKYALRPLKSEELFTFKVKMCDNSLDDRNFMPFSLNALKTMQKLYIGKTVGMDHSVKSSDQCARIYDTMLVQSEKTNGVNGEAVYELAAKCYMVRTAKNADLISEIEAGIKREVSTSCSASKLVCSVCGKDSLCAHYPGRDYGEPKQKCMRIISEVKDVYELSFVAVPAQPDASTYKAFCSPEEGATQEKELITAIELAEKILEFESEENAHESNSDE